MCLLLIVEDDYDTRVTLSALLAEAGYSVSDAGDGPSALSKLRSLRPDLVLMDYALPSPRDGENLLRAKAMEAAIATIPVIVMSGYALPPEMDGTVAVLLKPFDVDLLLAMIQRGAGPPEKPNTSAA